MCLMNTSGGQEAKYQQEKQFGRTALKAAGVSRWLEAQREVMAARGLPVGGLPGLHYSPMVHCFVPPLLAVRWGTRGTICLMNNSGGRQAKYWRGNNLGEMPHALEKL